jgi:hypothetical protein
LKQKGATPTQGVVMSAQQKRLDSLIQTERLLGNEFLIFPNKEVGFKDYKQFSRYIKSKQQKDPSAYLYSGSMEVEGQLFFYCSWTELGRQGFLKELNETTKGSALIVVAVK